MLIKKNDCAIFYVHNHKSGGTTMCHTAEMAGHKINKGINCNLPSRDKALWPNDIKRMNLSFAAQENGPFEPYMDLNNLLYMTTIRDPYDRIVSDFHHTLCQGTLEHARDIVRIHNCSYDVETASLTDIVMDSCFDTRMWYMTTNYYVRMFSGCKRDCNASHVKIATDKLEVMSVILLTNSPEQYDRFAS